MKELTDSIIQKLFLKTGVDRKYFPQYEAEVKSYYEDLIKGNGIDGDDEGDYIISCLDHADKYIKTYCDCISKGKSEIYAKQYAHRVVDYEEVKEFSDLYASKYEECINKGRDESKSKVIAWAYVDLYEKYWPEDDNMLGIEAHKGYMKGFEYAIDNNIKSPSQFADEYQEIYLSILFPHEMDKSLKKQWKYEEHLKKLFPYKF